MITLVIYLIGFLIVFVTTFIYNGYFDKDWSKSRKLIAYESFKFSLLSWVAIIIGLAIGFTYLVYYADKYISNKLNS